MVDTVMKIDLKLWYFLNLRPETLEKEKSMAENQILSNVFQDLQIRGVEESGQLSL